MNTENRLTDPIVLDVLDCQIKVIKTNAIIYAEPGCARITQETVELGNSAISQARLDPSRIYTRFWKELSLDPLISERPQIRHHADLVWHQLGPISSQVLENPVIACISSDLDERSLSLLSGVFESRGVKVLAFINRSLAQLSGCNIDASCAQVEIQMHDAVISYFDVIDGNFKLASKDTIAGMGVFRLIDRWLDLLRQRFISSSRFDPLHSGDSEQQLFDILLHSILTGSPLPRSFVIDTAPKNYRIDIAEQELPGITERFVSEIRSNVRNQHSIFWDSLFKNIPGMQPANKENKLDQGSLNRGALNLIDTLSHQAPKDGVAFIDEYPVGEKEPDKTKTAGVSTKDELATHLIFRGYIYDSNSLDKLCQLSGLSIVLKNNAFAVVAGQNISISGEPIVGDKTVSKGDEFIINSQGLTVVGARLSP